MARPQKENGYTPIANEIIDNLIQLPLNGTQWRIIATVWRYTYGFSRKEHDLSINFLLIALGLKKTQYKQICRELKELLNLNIIAESVKPDKNKTRVISFNKDYDLWSKKSSGLISPLDELDQTSKKSTGEEMAENKGIEASGLISPLVFLDHQDKQYIYKNKYTADFEKFYSEYPRPEDKNRSFTNWKTQLKHYTVEQLMTACRNYKKAKIGTDKQYLKSSANFLGREKPFEDFLQVQPETQSKYRDMTNYKPGE